MVITFLPGGAVQGTWVDATEFASMSFTFDSLTFNDHNNASITIEDTNGKEVTITIKNDGSAVFANNEFNAGDDIDQAVKNFRELFFGNQLRVSQVFKLLLRLKK